MKIAFLDRDGTINRDYPDAEWKTVTEPEIMDGSIQGMQYLVEKGYKIIIITNQYIIGEGIITSEQFNTFNTKLQEKLNEHGVSILDIFHCPHARSEHCRCCKPETGLIEQALEKYPSIDLGESFMCGDSVSDQTCAEHAGLKFYGIRLGSPCISNLSELCDYL